MPTARINGIDLYYEVHGSGPVLMLVAGLGSDSQSWLPVIDELARHFMLILPDNRGCGRTTPHEVETTIELISDDCMALLDELEIPSVIVLGHSMGAFIAMDCAVRYPQKVSQLVLEGASAFCSARNRWLLEDFGAYLKTGMESAQWFRSLYYWLFSPQFFEDSQVVNEAVRLSVEYPYPQSPAAYANQSRAIAAFDFRNQLPSVRQKTLILHGKKDVLFPPEESIDVLQAIPGACVSLVEGAAHSIHMEYPAAFVDRVLGFLGAD
ncbi:alpha/beta fold hydrolase [Endozoicomonas elysicola]|uniref:Alpha/beta hydrolase n=1 Tax=Endozoicomonas elysicola TaxID=305900 RepID=A0A081KDC6_9GAMM|nr:alpha/beta fold hydrolase [Endozoicomonas elysicola]KEI72152.1 alpha/beta hydrolase [Endozoicomonas elysicola]